MKIYSLLTQPENYGLSHFFLLQKLPHVLEKIDSSIFSPFHKLLLGAGEYVVQNEKEELSLGIVFPNHESITVKKAYLLESFFEQDVYWWPLAARLHAYKSEHRENQCRIGLSHQQIPFIMPNTLHELQIHAIAAGHKILHVLHVDWLRKLSAVILESLDLDVDNEGLWLYELLPSLDEKVARRKVESFLRKRSTVRYGNRNMAVAVLYGHQLGLDVEQYEQQLTEREKLLVLLGRECTKKILI
jgi:hypothetical protein